MNPISSCLQPFRSGSRRSKKVFAHLKSVIPVLVPVSKVETGTSGVSDLKMRNFSQGQESQEIAQTDTEIAEKGRFETETVLYYNANSGTPYYPTLPGIVPKRKLTKK